MVPTLRPLATAAAIPQELFDNIIRYINTHENGEARKGGRIAYELAKCALVSVHWAEVSRKLLYAGEGSWGTIRSLSQLKGLSCSARKGSKRLTPVHKLLQQLEVEQTWGTRSWIHNIYLAHFDRDRNELRLTGPEAYGLPPLPVSALRSPHWSVPRTLPSCFLNFSSLDLFRVHFPALSDFAKLVKHFVRTEIFYFRRVTWDVTDVVIPSRALSHGKLREINAQFCKDTDVLHAQTHLMLNKANIPFYRLPSLEQEACLQIFSTLYGCTERPQREKEERLLSSFCWLYPSEHALS